MSGRAGSPSAAFQAVNKMKYSKRQIEVWKARESLSEKLARMPPDEITAHAEEVAADRGGRAAQAAGDLCL
jgi:hypothetical protein